MRERNAVKVACSVLRGGRNWKESPLPDTEKMLELLIASLWGLQIFFNFGMVGNLVISFIVQKQYKKRSFRFFVRYLLLVAITALILRISEKAMEPIANFLAHINPILLLTLELLVLLCCIIEAICIWVSLSIVAFIASCVVICVVICVVVALWREIKTLFDDFFKA